MDFKKKIGLAVAFLITTVISSTLVFSLYEMEKQIKENTITEMATLSERVGNDITGRIESGLQTAGFISKLVLTHKEDTGLRRELLSSRDVMESFTVAGGTLEDGTNIRGDMRWHPKESWDGRTRPWYKQALGITVPNVTEPYRDSITNKMIISITVPLLEGRKFLGAMFYDLDFHALGQEMHVSSQKLGARSLLIDKNNKVIIHWKDEEIGESINTHYKELNLQERFQIIEVKGKRLWVYINDQMPHGWRALSFIEEDLIYTPLRRLRSEVIVMSIISLIISSMLIVFILRIFMGPLDALGEALEEVASGECDLTKKLDESTDPEFAKMAVDFNTFSGLLRNEITALKETGDDLNHRSHSGIILSEDTKDSVKGQLTELEQLATAMEEMAATSDEVAQSAQVANTIVSQAADIATAGVSTISLTSSSIDQLSMDIDHTMELVETLSQSTVKIDTVLAVINDIADQTNLLALNAAIEAARAGDQGRGFAVVADEVRSLAQRTQESTTEIRATIEELQSAAISVNTAMASNKDTAISAVDGTNDAQMAFEQITESVKSIADVNIQIATAAEEQSVVAGEINVNTVRIKELSLNVASHANELHDGMVEQQEDILKQTQTLARFKV